MHNETEYGIGYVEGQLAAERRSAPMPYTGRRDPVPWGPFEEFARSRRLDITKKDGRYVSGATRAAWDIWQEVVDHAARYARVCAGEQAEESVRNMGA